MLKAFIYIHNILQHTSTWQARGKISAYQSKEEATAALHTRTMEGSSVRVRDIQLSSALMLRNMGSMLPGEVSSREVSSWRGETVDRAVPTFWVQPRSENIDWATTNWTGFTEDYLFARTYYCSSILFTKGTISYITKCIHTLALHFFPSSRGATTQFPIYRFSTYACIVDMGDLPR